MKNPLVSVIIPNYNHARYLEKRILSVLNQSYNNFEVIILDDKSTDDSIRIIDKYSSNPLVSNVVINSVNSGSTFIQWDRGFLLAKGELIWIAESDDYCEPDLLEKLVSAYKSNDRCVVAYCSSQYVDSEDNELPTVAISAKHISTYTGERFIKHKMAYGSAIWNASSAIFDKKVALSLSKEYQTYKACGDRLFWIKMAEKGNVIHLNESLNYFRQHLNKVSPRRFRDGTSMSEEYQIHSYLCKKKYISGLRHVYILSLYYDKIYKGDFDEPSIKMQLMQLWKFNNPFKRISIKLLSRVYIYISLYILRTKPL